MRKKLRFTGYLTLQASQEFRIGKKIPLLLGSTFPVEGQGGLVHRKGTKKG
jgi:hypothetical protein